MSSCSVVILNWNGVKHLREFLPSVVLHTPDSIEVIVADNGSVDDSLEMIRKSFPRVKIVELDKNYGFAEGYNRALKMVHSEYYILLNSDVEVSPMWCEPLIDFMQSNSSYAAVAPKLLAYTQKEYFEYAGACGGYIDWLGYPFCRGRILSSIERDHGQYDTNREVFWASGAALCIRSKVFDELGGFDGEFFAHMEEIGLCWRAQILGYKIGVVPQSAVYHLGGGTLAVTSPRKTYLNFRNNLAMLYKNLPQRKLYITLFIRMVLDGCSALVYLLSNRELFKAVFNAHMDFHKWRKKLDFKRENIQKTAVRESTQIYKKSILLDYLFGKKEFKDIDK